jgi:hypothetical protein
VVLKLPNWFVNLIVTVLLPVVVLSKLSTVKPESLNKASIYVSLLENTLTTIPVKSIASPR